MEDHAVDSCYFTRIRCIQQGPQASRIQFRWFDGRVRPYAGRRHGKRSPRRLFPLSPDPVAIRQHWEDWLHFFSLVDAVVLRSLQEVEISELSPASLARLEVKFTQSRHPLASDLMS